MDSAFQKNNLFGDQTDLVSLSSVILVRSELEAELFFSKLFPLVGNVVLVSADGVYPKNVGLNEEVKRELANNDSIAVVTFDSSLIRKMSVRTSKILCLDGLIMADYRMRSAYWSGKIGFGVEKLATVINTYFQQWQRIERSNGAYFEFFNSVFYLQPKETDLAAQLVFRDRRSIFDFQVAEISHSEFMDLEPALFSLKRDEIEPFPFPLLERENIEALALPCRFYFTVHRGFDLHGVFAFDEVGPSAIAMVLAQTSPDLIRSELGLELAFATFRSVWTERTLFLNLSKSDFHSVDSKRTQELFQEGSRGRTVRLRSTDSWVGLDEEQP